MTTHNERIRRINLAAIHLESEIQQIMAQFQVSRTVACEYLDMGLYVVRHHPPWAVKL